MFVRSAVFLCSIIDDRTFYTNINDDMHDLAAFALTVPKNSPQMIFYVLQYGYRYYFPEFQHYGILSHCYSLW